jgi:hypothetical protein
VLPSCGVGHNDDGISKNISPVFCFLLSNHASEKLNCKHKITRKLQRYPDLLFIDRSKKNRSTIGSGQLHTHFRVCFILDIENLMVTVE